ncbi:MAG: hypothetical protein A2Z70_01090 [Chloroflexi bacterium RBG_13_48_17]|nr:MAG: hypothetical protein A2Z70_01090 [Chloroflexi bacterium RBG_13_48_17]
MKISIMQPTYLPWLGYFELIDRSDTFVFFDDVQFEPKSWHQRNRLKGPNGEQMLTVPVLTAGKRYQKICEAEIDNKQQWAVKHIRSIEFNYSKTPFFNNYIKPLKEIYEKEWVKLVDLNLALVSFLMGQLKITTPVICSSALKIESSDDRRVIDICKKLGAEELYDAAGARALLNLGLFQEEGIRLTFQDYKHPAYRQLHGSFIPYLSVIDLLFNEGERSLEIIRSGGGN